MSKHGAANTVDQTTSAINYTTGAATSILPGIGGYSATASVVPYVDCRQTGGLSVYSAITVDTNAAGTWASTSVDTSLYQVTITAHGYKTGLLGQASTAGSLPTGLSTSTNYYIIVVNANTVAFATTQANALAGTRIHLTAAGSGNSTFTPTALAGATVVGQWSLDNVTWNSIGSATNITVTSTFTLTQDRPTWPFFRLKFTITAGSLTVANTYYTYSDKGPS